MSRSPKPKRRRASFAARVRSNFLTGLVVVLPVALTIYLIWSFIGFVDNRVLPLVPDAYNPSTYLGVDVRGWGVVVFLVFTTFIGALTKGFFGRSILRYVERLVDRVPIVRSIYNAIRQIIETVVNNNKQSFENACLVEYPRKGIWAIAFISTETSGEILPKAGQKAMYSVFLPTTPNPTSGFLLFIPKEDVVILDMDVEEAAKLIISAGLVTPPTEEEKRNGRANKAHSNVTRRNGAKSG